jgi:hypothetical protein
VLLRGSIEDVVEACARAGEESVHQRGAVQIGVDKERNIITATWHFRAPKEPRDQLRRKSWVVEIGAKEPGQGSLLVFAIVKHYYTRQEKLFGVIPFGPKVLLWSQQLNTFLDVLEREFLALDGVQAEPTFENDPSS